MFRRFANILCYSNAARGALCHALRCAGSPAPLRLNQLGLMPLQLSLVCALPLWQRLQACTFAALFSLGAVFAYLQRQIGRLI